MTITTRTAPLVTVLAAFVSGIIVADTLTLPVWLWCALTVSIAVPTVVMLRRKYAFVGVMLTVLSAAAVITAVHNNKPHTVTGQAARLTVEITDRAVSNANGTFHNSVRDCATGDLLTLYYDGTEPLSAGSLIQILTTVKPLGDNSYSRLMASRGYVGRAFVSAQEIRHVGHHNRPRYLALAVQNRAAQRLERLSLGQSELAVVEAMTIGRRTSTDASMRDAYSRTGCSHVLAISGLHVGIVFLIINALLYAVPLFKRGHIVKCIVALLLIWCYTFVSGLSPSAVRAAVMFSGLQVGLITSEIRSPLNSIAAAALLMLTVRPDYLYDTSFQMSFAAVCGITLWFSPMFNAVRSGSRLLNALWGALLVGITASIAVLPLTACHFGQVSVVGFLLSPAVVALAYIIVTVGLVWILLPPGFATPLFSAALGYATEALNNLVFAVAALPKVAAQWSPSVAATISIYAAMLLLTYSAYSLKAKHTAQ